MGPVLAALAGGCSESPRVLAPVGRVALVGRVTDEGASLVRAYPIGSTAPVGESEPVEGTYTLTVPADTALLLLAVDEEDVVLGAAVVPSTGPAGEVIAAVPLDVESTVEALVLEEALDAGLPWDAVEARLRIDPETAEDALRVESLGGDAFGALAEAAALARTTTLQGWSAEGATLASDPMSAMLDADRTFARLLHEGASRAEADEALIASLRAAYEDAGIPPVAQARADAMAGVAWRRVLAERVLDVAEATALAAARLEARAHLAAVEALTADADAGLRDDAARAAEDLIAHVDAATSSLESASAYERFEQALATAALAQRVQGDALEAAADGADVLDATLVAVVSDALADDDADRVPTEVVAAWTSWRAQTEAALAAEAPTGDAEVGLAVVGGGSFRATAAR